MTNTITQLFKRPKTQLVVLLTSAFLIFMMLSNPDKVIPIVTQSIFGLAGIGISIAVIGVIVGAFLIIVPEPATTMIGIVMVGVSIFIGGASIFGAVEALVGPIGLFIVSGIIIFFGIKNLRDISLRRQGLTLKKALK